MSDAQTSTLSSVTLMTQEADARYYRGRIEWGLRCGGGWPKTLSAFLQTVFLRVSVFLATHYGFYPTGIVADTASLFTVSTHSSHLLTIDTDCHLLKYPT